jgi:hypothetical protein
MKLLSIVSLAATMWFAAGCSDPLEQRSSDEVGAQLKSGITGQGKLGTVQRPEDDPAAQHGIPQGQ